jgi:retron-type reverse transcriptase
MDKTDSIKLNMIGLPVIQNIDDFADITHISKNTIYQLSYHSDAYYRIYTIPKKSGKVRTISQPSKKLKGLQSWILVQILNKLKVSTSSKGFEKSSSILDNALVHKGANATMTLDLKDFFSTITRRQVYNIFSTVGYNRTISTILTNICVYKGVLPQGGPCSPKLANLVLWTLDLRIQGYVGKRGINYTRYADDLTFSGLNPAKVIKVMPMIKQIIRDENFELNHSKTRVAGTARAKIVTGLIISDEQIGIGKNKFKELRSKIHYLTLPAEQTNEKLLYEVIGWLSYLNSVDKTRFAKANKYIEKLIEKYPDTLVSKVNVKRKPT